MTRNQLQAGTATEALQFIVEFAQADLLSLGVNEYLRTVKQLQTFIDRGRNTQGFVGPPSIKELSAELPYHQERAFEVIQNVVTHEHFLVAGDLVLTFWAVRQDGRVRLAVGGSHVDRMLFECARLLEQAGTGKIKKCPASNCRRIFVKVTKKDYCSTRCQSRTYMQKRRAEERAEKEIHGKKTRTRGR